MKGSYKTKPCQVGTCPTAKHSIQAYRNMLKDKSHNNSQAAPPSLQITSVKTTDECACSHLKKRKLKLQKSPKNMRWNHPTANMLFCRPSQHVCRLLLAPHCSTRNWAKVAFVLRLPKITSFQGRCDVERDPFVLSYGETTAGLSWKKDISK